MANIQIPNLPGVVGLSGTELFEGVQSGSSVKISLDQISAAIRTGLPTTLPLSVDVGGTGVTTSTGTVSVVLSDSPTLTGNVSVASNSASTAFKITQTGSGNAFVVEDSSSPDSSPFIVDASGNVGIGTASPSALLNVYNATQSNIALSGDGNTTFIASRASTDTNPASLNFRKLRGTTASPTSIVSGDTLGNSNYSAWDGSAFINTAQIQGSAETVTGVGDISGYLRFLTRPSGSGSSVTERMRIDASGNVGVGVTSPSAKLDVNGNAHLRASGSFSLFNSDNTNSFYIQNIGATGSANPIFDIVQNGVGARFRIGSLGQFGIGGANYGTTGQTIVSAGSGAAPAWGTLPVSGGGTGVTTAPAEAARIMGYTSTATAAGTTALTNASSQYQMFTGATTQTITLPVTSTLTTGWTFHIVNNSTGSLTVNSSGGNLVCTVISGMTAMVTCIGTTLTTAADWEFGFTDFGSITGTGAVVLDTGPTITSGAFNGTVGATTPSSVAATTVAASTSVLSTGAGGVGYATGAGVAVTQLTSRTTTVPTTGAKTTGAITLFTAAPVVGTYFSFTVPNTGIAATDTVVLTVRGATNTYVASVTAITAATSFQVTMASVVGIASDTPIVNFAIIKGVSA